MSGPQVILVDAGPGLSPAARHLRDAFAQRHVPLPGPLAESLALFLESRQPLRDPVWGRAYACMARALDLPGALGSQMLLAGARDRFVQLVCEPVLRHAAAVTGVLPLAASGGSPDPGAESRVAAVAGTALESVAVMGRAFWVHAGLDLLRAAQSEARRRSAGRRRKAVPAPEAETDAALAALVFLHPPCFAPDLLREKARRKARHVSANRRSGIRPKEGGVAGIRQSGSLEDMADSLFSELMMPKALFANKLLHEGLLVRHRPPRRDPKRDLLAVTLMDAGPDDGMALLVKAAWADAAIRLRVALRQMGLMRSDLLWSQTGGQVATLGCTGDADPTDQVAPLAIAGRVRADMLLRGGLFPGLAALPPRGAAVPRPDLLRAGITGLAAGQGRDPGALTGDYGMRLLLAAGPHAGRRAPDWSLARAELMAALVPAMGGRSHLACLTWSRLSDTAPDLLCRRDGADDLRLALPATGQADSDAQLGAFMGHLVDWLMTATLEALDVVQA